MRPRTAAPTTGFCAGGIVLALFAAADASCAAASSSDRKGWSFRFTMENDAISPDNRDRNYTNGMQFAIEAPENTYAGFACGFIRWWTGRIFGKPIAAEKPHSTCTGLPRPFRWGLRVGQLLYTPENIENPVTDPDDRPYAAWLYGGLDLISENEVSLHRMSLDLGVIGPKAQGKEIQTWFHGSKKDANPEGWDNQVAAEESHTEFGALLAYTYRRRLFDVLRAFDPGGPCVGDPSKCVRYFDIVPAVRMNVGNVVTSLDMGTRIRGGWNVSDRLGPEIITPSGVDSQSGGRGAFSCHCKDFTAYGVLGVTSKVVAYNVFLDGGTPEGIPDVDKRTVVADFEVGVVLGFKGFFLNYIQVWRTPEFHGGDGWHSFGSASLGYAFR